MFDVEITLATEKAVIWYGHERYIADLDRNDVYKFFTCEAGSYEAHIYRFRNNWKVSIHPVIGGVTEYATDCTTTLRFIGG
jgi:hypothetical protein